MHTGIVKQFSDALGYGFIRLEGCSEDIFVHHSAIKVEGFRTLYAGEKVQFQIKKDEKGLKALNVQRLSDLAMAEPPPAEPQG
jgi:CspA family cold shock protein